MTLLSRLLARVAHLPPAETYHVLVERDLKIPMPDGVVLLANRYAPRGVEKPPLLLVRSSYGRRGIFGTAYGRLFAERGFQVVMQSIRGTFGSGGTLDPFNEHDDGLATVAWLKQQPWYPDSFMTTGPAIWASCNGLSHAMPVQISRAWRSRRALRSFAARPIPGEPLLWMPRSPGPIWSCVRSA